MNKVGIGSLLSIGLLVLSTAMSDRVMAGSITASSAEPLRIAQANSTPATGNSTATKAGKVATKPRQKNGRAARSQDKKAMTMKKGPLGEMAEIPTDVMFGSGSSELRPEAVNILAECAEMIRRDGNKNMQVIGHTDSVGSASYNVGLSKRRAEAVTAWLVDQGGIPKEDLTTTGVGEAKPKASNGTAKGRAQNRRVEVVMPMGGSPHQPMPEEKK
jgi:OOP family OmpA-OmpF porin